MDTPALAVYGSLGPGGPNHHRLAPLRGTWTRGTVTGRLLAEGWGADLGYPGLVLDPDGEQIAVDLLLSPRLADAWADLDAFEGPGYARTAVTVTTADGPVAAWIYALAR